MKRMLLVISASALVSNCGAGGSQSGAQASLVRAEVKRLEHGRDVDIDIERAKLQPLPGLGLYNATVLVPDHPGYRCAVAAKQAWCDGDQRLANVVKEFSLGTKPDQLTEPEWIELAIFLTGARALPTAGKANLLEDHATATATAEIEPPRVDRSDAGLQLSYYTERVSYGGYPSGPMSLVQVTITIAPSNAVSLTTRVVWSSENPTCEAGQTALSTGPRFDCANDHDCTNSCKFGAINKTWFAILGPGCKDGCANQISGPPRCIDGLCVAFTEDGARRDSCTNLAAPEKVCVAN